MRAYNAHVLFDAAKQAAAARRPKECAPAVTIESSSQALAFANLQALASALFFFCQNPEKYFRQGRIYS